MSIKKECYNEFATKNAFMQNLSEKEEDVELSNKLDTVVEWILGFFCKEERDILFRKIHNDWKRVGKTPSVEGTIVAANFFYELLYGKWQFMMVADCGMKKNPGRAFYMREENFDVEMIDASLFEIQHHLNCEVLKMWQKKGHVIFNKADEDNPNLQDNTVRRIGWLIAPNIVDNKKEVAND